MKKNQIAICAAIFMLAATACSKDDEQKTSDNSPVCQTIEFHVDWSCLSSDIANNLKITASGKDFNGKVFSHNLTGEAGELTFTKENVNIDNDSNHCPFTYKIDVESLVESGDETKEYNLQIKLQVYAVFKDAAGKALYTGSSDDSTKDFIRNINYSQPWMIKGFENFQEKVTRIIGSEEATYVFFRGQSAVSGDYFFSHSI